MPFDGGFYGLGWNPPEPAASAFPAGAVAYATGGLIGLATNAVQSVGFAIDAASVALAPVRVVAPQGTIRPVVVAAVAAASIGAGSEVGIASTNGAFGPIVASGFYSIGKSITAAVAGDTFGLQVRPRQLP